MGCIHYFEFNGINSINIDTKYGIINTWTKHSIAQCLVFCVVICKSMFVLFLMVTALSILLRFTAYDLLWYLQNIHSICSRCQILHVANLTIYGVYPLFRVQWDKFHQYRHQVWNYLVNEYKNQNIVLLNA
jgi:hypothetical protein